MRRGSVAKGQRRGARDCRHHWVIASASGATRRGHCKRCGAEKEFPSAVEELSWDGGGLQRWTGRETGIPQELTLPEVTEDEF